MEKPIITFRKATIKKYFWIILVSFLGVVIIFSASTNPIFPCLHWAATSIVILYQAFLKKKHKFGVGASFFIGWFVFVGYLSDSLQIMVSGQIIVIVYGVIACIYLSEDSSSP